MLYKFCLIKLATSSAESASFISEIKLMKLNPVKIIIVILFLFNISVFAQTDVPRQTTAITYALDDEVTVPFRGTTRFPRMSGKANIKRTKRNGTEIDLSVSKMPRPFELGAGYATYVLWAISPDGQVDNLGEIKRRGFFEFDSKISVTTPLQIFALIITAEPHFLVKQPSREIMLENLNPTSLNGKFVPTTKSVQYFGNSSDYFRDARTPEIAETDYSKTPSTVLQAKQAVALARFAGANRDAVDELKTAEDLLNTADSAWRNGRPEEEVNITARQSISAAVKAEETAVSGRTEREKRNDKQRSDAEIQRAEDKLEAANREIENLKAEIAREQRNRELAERDGSNYSQQVKELRDENRKLSEELGRVKLELETSKSKLNDIEVQKRELEAQKQIERDNAEKERLSEEKRQQQLANVSTLISLLQPFGRVAQTDKGIVLTLPETTWTTTRTSSFSAKSAQNMNTIAGILANNPDYKFIVEAHTDNTGKLDILQTLTQQRSQTIADKLIESGISSEKIQANGFGATYPIAPNTTNANKAKNRRTEIILVLAEN
jgi:outer membrane protein OmpA-like peptidoglycan-associated protein